MFEMTRTRVFALALSGLVAAPTATLAADIPAKKMTNAGLHATAAEAATMLADPQVLFVEVPPETETLPMGDNCDYQQPWPGV